jgi:hypothetical protein
MRENMKQMYNNINPTGASDMVFADTIINKAEAGYGRRSFWSRFNSPVVALAVVMVMIGGAALFVLSGGLQGNDPLDYSVDARGQSIENMSDEELLAILADMQKSNVVFDVDDFYSFDDFGAEPVSGEFWTKIDNTSAKTEEEAVKAAGNYAFQFSVAARDSVELLGENDYYYAFRFVWNPVLNDDDDANVDTERVIVFKESALAFFMHENPQSPVETFYHKLGMLDRQSVKDLLDAQIYFDYYWATPSRNTLHRVIHRSLTESRDGFVYTFYLVQREAQNVVLRKYYIEVDKNSGRFDLYSGWQNRYTESILKNVEIPLDFDQPTYPTELTYPTEATEPINPPEPIEPPEPTDKVLEFKFPDDTVVYMGNQHGHCENDYWFRPIWLIITQTGLEIEYYPAVPGWSEDGKLSDGFMFSENDLRMHDLRFDFFNKERGQYHGSRFLGNDNTVDEHWDFSGALNFTVDYADMLTGEVRREKLTFAEPIDIESLYLISMGNWYYDISFNYAYDTRKLVLPDDLSDSLVEMYSIIQLVNRPAGFNIAYNQFNELESLPYGNAGIFRLSDMEKAHYMFYSENGNVPFDPEMYGDVLVNPSAYTGEVLNGTFIEPPWAGGYAGLTPVPIEIADNADGTVTFTVVRATAPNHGDTRVVHYEERENGEWEEFVLGYRCPYNGKMYYIPEMTEFFSPMQYTMVREDDRYKILSVVK